MHVAVRFVTSLSRSVSVFSTDYGHPERAVRVEGSFAPAASCRRQFVHTAPLFVTSLTRSVTVLSTDYGHPEQVKRVEGSFHRILDTLDSVLSPNRMERFFGALRVPQNDSGKAAC